MKTVLVYGATGWQSRPVAHKLLDAGFGVRVRTRHPEKAADLVARGAQIAQGDVAALAVETIERPALANLNLKAAGPERLDGDGMAASFGRALGRPIRYDALTPAAFGAMLGRLSRGVGPAARAGVRTRFCALGRSEERSMTRAAASR